MTMYDVDDDENDKKGYTTQSSGGKKQGRIHVSIIHEKMYEYEYGLTDATPDQQTEKTIS